jgi:hypothetical protein
LSCRPPVKVPRAVRRAPAKLTPNRAAAGWRAWQADQVAAGQLQCLVRRAALPQSRPPRECPPARAGTLPTKARLASRSSAVSFSMDLERRSLEPLDAAVAGKVPPGTCSGA